ncbi:hypothetical protein ALC57_13155, partial [Trachymyrmex cornetzi]
FKKNITDGSRCLVGNSGCAAFCVLRNELKFNQNFLFSSADGVRRSSLTRIIFGASATILFQNEGLRYGNNHSPSVHTISSIRRQRVPMGASGCDRSKSFLASFLDSHGSAIIKSIFSLRAHLRLCISRSCDSIWYDGVALTRVVSYMEKHAT